MRTLCVAGAGSKQTLTLAVRNTAGRGNLQRQGQFLTREVGAHVAIVEPSPVTLFSYSVRESWGALGRATRLPDDR